MLYIHAFKNSKLHIKFLYLNFTDISFLINDNVTNLTQFSRDIIP